MDDGSLGLQQWTLPSCVSIRISNLSEQYYTAHWDGRKPNHRLTWFFFGEIAVNS